MVDDDRDRRRAQRDQEIDAFVRAQSDAADGISGQGEVARFWDGLGAEAEAPAIQAMLSDARSRIERDATVVPFRRRLSMSIITALAASLLAAIGIGSWFAVQNGTMGQNTPSRILANGATAPRSFRLADRSTVTLDARSAIELPAWTDERRVKLTSGRAFFKVVHDRARPFVVMASGHRITDLGTSFSVETDRTATVVTLVEGSVRVLPTRANAAVDLKPNNMLTMPAGGGYRLAPIDAAVQNEWRDGRISFDNQPASAVLSRMNRYFTDDIILSDSEQGRTLISGTFRLDDRDDILRALSQMGLKTAG